MRKLYFIFFIFLFILNFVFAQNYKVVDIRIEGNQKITKEEILKIINVKIGSEVDDKKIEEIEKKLKDTTFFLSVNIVKTPTKDGLILTFQVVENPLLIWISGIRFLGLNKVSIEKIRSLLFLNPLGWSTDIQVWNQRKKFLETGYFEDVEVKEENIDGGILVSFIFKEKSVLEKINYFSLKRIPQSLVESVIKLELGDFVSESLIEEKKQALEETNLFSKIDFSFVEDNGKASVIFYFVENPIVSQITFNKLNKVSPLDIVKLLDLKGEIKENTFYSSENIFYSQKIEDLWKEKLINTGYFENLSFENIEKEGFVEINITFKENPVVLSIFINGNKNLSKEKILSLLSLKRREFYSEKFVEEKKEILLNSGYFQEVQVDKKILPFGVYLTFNVKENPILSSLNFEGLELEEALWKDKVILKKGDFINEEKIREQLAKFEELGYFQEINVEKNIMEDKIELTFKFTMNPIVKKISFQGIYSISGEELKKIMKTKENFPINYAFLREDFERLQNYLQQKGFVFTVLQEFKFTQDGNLILIFRGYQVEDIKVEIQSATETSVLGFLSFLRKPTEEDVVRREISLKIGEAFNWEKVKYDLQRIYNAGIFEDVSIKLDPGSSEDKIKVTYVAKEKLTGSINFGGGYGFSSGFYGYIEYKEDNFLGKAQKLSLSAQVTGQGKINYQLGFKDPWFLGARNNFELNLYDKKSTIKTLINDEEKTIDEERAGGTFSFYYPISGNISLGIGFKYENVWQTISGVPYTQSNISSINFSLIRDTRDFVLSPTQGSRQSLSIEFAGGGSSSNFAKYQGNLQWHIPLTQREAITISQMKERQVLSFKISFGFSDGNLPSTEFFTLGGANSIRGYIDNEFRGNSFLLFNLQYKFPLGNSVYGVAFWDVGNAFDLSNITSLNDIKLYNGIGIGIRYETILIPIRLDLGYNFGQDPLDPNTKWRVHFSFGDVF